MVDITKKSVARWRPQVEIELQRQKIPLPADLVLSVMAVESNGHPGLVNPKSGASGLGQIMPITLKDFNQRTGKSYTMNDMQSSDAIAAHKQIEVMVSIIGHYWRRAYQYLSKRLQVVPVDEVGKMADLYYVAGPGATQKRADQISDPTFSAIETAYHDWNALPHPRKVFAQPKPWNIPAIDSWLSSSLKNIEKKKPLK